MSLKDQDISKVFRIVIRVSAIISLLVLLLLYMEKDYGYLWGGTLVSVTYLWIWYTFHLAINPGRASNDTASFMMFFGVGWAGLYLKFFEKFGESFLWNSKILTVAFSYYPMVIALGLIGLFIQKKYKKH